MQMRSSDENNVRLSVCLSNAWIVMKREKNQSRFLYTTRKIIYPSFTRKTMIGGADVNFGSNRPRWSEIADFSSIFARNVLAVTPSEERSINTNNKSTTRFPMSRCPMLRKGGVAQNRKTADFRLKSHFAWRKSLAYKVSLCENCQRQSCEAFIGLTVRAKMTGGATPSTWNFGSNWPRWSEIADCRFIFSRI